MAIIAPDRAFAFLAPAFAGEADPDFFAAIIAPDIFFAMSAIFGGTAELGEADPDFFAAIIAPDMGKPDFFAAIIAPDGVEPDFFAASLAAEPTFFTTLLIIFLNMFNPFSWLRYVSQQPSSALLQRALLQFLALSQPSASFLS